MPGSIEHIFIKPAHGKPLQSAPAAEAIGGKGLQGDISFGRRKRQVLIIESETLQDFGLLPGMVRENLTVSGVQLAGLPAGTRLRAGAATLEVTMDCAPCQMMDELKPGLQAAIAGRRGTLFRVIEGGEIKVGDPVTVLVAEPA